MQVTWWRRVRCGRVVLVLALLCACTATGSNESSDDSLDGAARSYPATILPIKSFPTASTTGVPREEPLTRWDGPLTTSEADLPTTVVGGRVCDVIDGYRFELQGDQQLRIDSPCVVIRRSSFVTKGETSSLVIQTEDNEQLDVDQSTFDGGPLHVRGVQADYADVTVQRSLFVHFGNAAIEMSDRSATATLTVEGCFLRETPGWPRDQHVDGVQMNAGGRLEVRGNTIIVAPFGGVPGDYSYVSNSAIGVGATLANVGGVSIVGNLLAGGGHSLYVEEKDFRMTGSVTVASNVFDQRFFSAGPLYGVLYPDGVPAAIDWSGNTWSDGSQVDLDTALQAAA